MFDLENTGFCASSDLGHIMRGLGMVVSEDELGKIINHVSDRNESCCMYLLDQCQDSSVS